jgi:hypothetical protein
MVKKLRVDNKKAMDVEKKQTIKKKVVKPKVAEQKKHKAAKEQVKQQKAQEGAQQKGQQQSVGQKMKAFTTAQKKRTTQVKKHIAGKKSKMTSKEVEKQLDFRKSIQEKIHKNDEKIQKLNTDKCLTLLIKCMDVIKKQLQKNPTPTNKKDRERVILSLIKINLVDKHFKDRQKIKDEKEFVKAARVQIKDFFKVLNTIK